VAESLTTYAFILILPLAGFVIQMLIGKRLPRGGDWVILTAIGAAFVLSAVVFIQALFGHAFEHQPFQWVFEDWLRTSSLMPSGWTLPMGILVDNITAMMLVVVTGCGLLIFTFSTGYMQGHPRYSRFFGYLGLFAFSMLVLVLGNNLIALYVGWELVGVSSYLLIGFLHDEEVVAPDINPGAASKKAFITNRVGDIGFFLGILTVFLMTGQLQYHDVFASVAGGAFDAMPWLLTLAGILLFMGAIGKSAQFPLHVWLPDAMAGPTPVSALIHAATMVAAGVYMVGRIYPLLTPDALTFIAYIGAITAFFAASIALVMTDIKRVLAYSTISQLGFMIFGLGVGAYTAGMFHLMTHAIFKALLFLASGSVIHAMHGAYHHTHKDWNPETGENDAQDMRNMGGLRKYMPITFVTMFIATLAISGVPFTSGFLSKDAILGGALAYGVYLHPQHFLIPLLGYLAAAMTAFYMFRLIFMTFLGENRTGEQEREGLHESPLNMTIPLMVFATFSIWIWYNWDPTAVFGHGWMAHFIEKPETATMTAGLTAALGHTPYSVVADATHSAHIPAMLLSLLVAGSGIFVAWQMHKKGTISFEAWRKQDTRLYRMLANKYYVDEFYEKTFIALVHGLARISAAFDKLVIDGIVNGVASFTQGLSEFSGLVDKHGVDGLVNAMATVTRRIGDRVRTVQTGRVQNYLVYAVIGAIVLILIVR
jgi:NADH-quinone oxidoreductase subunit L